MGSGTLSSRSTTLQNNEIRNKKKKHKKNIKNKIKIKNCV